MNDMNDMNDTGLLDELLSLRPAFADLVRHVCVPGSDNPDHADLAGVREGIEEMGIDRAAALIYAHRYADTISEARGMIELLLRWMEHGRRPRSMMQLKGS